ncbi:MAG: glycosyltransferase family 39 protein [Patescibacteria group bacterium]
MKKIWQEWKWVILILIGVIGVALFLRLYNLTLLPVFVDEAIYIRWSQIMGNEPTLRFLPLSDGKQPLYMWVLMFFVRHFSDPLYIGRLISAISGIGTLLGIFALTFVLFKSKKVALIASFLYCLSPFFVFFDRMALVDSMLNFFGVWTVFFAVLTSKTRRLDMAMITGFFLGFMLLTKSPAIFFVILLPFTWFLVKEKFQTLKLIILYGITLIISYGMYNILRLGPNFHLIAMRNLDYVYPYSHILTDPLNPLKGHMGGIISYFILLTPLSLVPLFAFGIFLNLKKNLKTILPILALAIGPLIVIAEYSKVVTARYILFTIPFFIILAASIFISKSKLIKYFSVFFLIIFVIQSINFDYKLLTKVETVPLPYGDRSGYLEEWTAGQGIKEIASYLKNEARDLPAGRQIIIGTEGYFGTLPQGLEMYLTDTDNVLVIGVGLGINQIPQSLKESKEAGNKTYLVINRSRLSVEPEKIGLKLISSYEKPPRRVGSMEYTLYGPQEALYFFEIE